MTSCSSSISLLLCSPWCRLFYLCSPGLAQCRRCKFPVEIGLRMQAPCRLQEVVVVSEPRLAPTAVECFVSGPARSRRQARDKRTSATFPQGVDQRHNGSTTVSRWWSNAYHPGGGIDKISGTLRHFASFVHGRRREEEAVTTGSS